MLCFGPTDTLYALASATGVQYTFDQDVPSGGADVFGTPPQGTIPTSVGSIFSALGTGVSGTARIMMFNPTGAGIQVTLYKNGSTYGITACNIPAGGSATFDGIEIRVFNSVGSRQ